MVMHVLPQTPNRCLADTPSEIQHCFALYEIGLTHHKVKAPFSVIMLW